MVGVAKSSDKGGMLGIVLSQKKKCYRGGKKTIMLISLTRIFNTLPETVDSGTDLLTNHRSSTSSVSLVMLFPQRRTRILKGDDKL